MVDLTACNIANSKGYYSHNQWRWRTTTKSFIECKKLGYLKFDKKINSRSHHYILTEKGKEALKLTKGK